MKEGTITGIEDHSTAGGDRRGGSERCRRLLGWAVTAIAIYLTGVSGVMERLFYYPSAGRTPAPEGVDHVRFESADGTALVGWFIPAGGEPRGTILHVHGNAGNLLDHVGLTEYLPEAGFNVFVFDYRGYGESEGKPRRRRDLIADAHAALDTLLERDDVDPERIGMYGQSLGAAIGMNVMADRPEIRAAVLESGFTSWRDVAADSVGGAEPGIVARSLARWLIPDHDRPIDAIARIDRPVLILHGTADTIVRVHHGQRLAEAKPDASLMIVDGGDHNTLRWSHPEVDDAVKSFLEREVAGR